MSESVVAMLAAFRGEHLVLQRGRDGLCGSLSNNFPQECRGLPSLVVLDEAAADAPETLQGLIRLLGTKADVLAPWFVARMWVKNAAGLYQVQIVFTCIMGGYFDGEGFKPDKLPETFYPGHARALEYVMYSRQRQGYG